MGKQAVIADRRALNWPPDFTRIAQEPALPARLAGEDIVSVRAQIIQKLREDIVSGVLPPGGKLSDTQLCQSLGVSRTSVREALPYLESMRLITVTSGRMRVSRLSLGEAQTIYQLLGIMLSDAAAHMLNEKRLESLYPFQAMAEELAHGLAAEAYAESCACAVRFYKMILRTRGNHIISEIVQNLIDRTAFLRGQAHRHPPHCRAVLTECAAMLDAILGGQGAMIRVAVMAHFSAEAARVEMIFAPVGAG